MKHSLILFFLLCTIPEIANAQQAEIGGAWQLLNVKADGEIYENLKAIYVFEEGGILKAARSAQSELIAVGKWKFSKKQNALIMRSTLDKDFDGNATLIKISDSELVYEKDEAILYFKRIEAANLAPDNKSTSVAINIPRLNFTETDFFDDDNEYKYYDDEEKLPWQDVDDLLMSLVNVKQLVYNYAKLDNSTGEFNNEILTADVNSNPSEQALSIDYIFYGYDRYNLPEDVALQPNDEYLKPLYPEEENTFRIAGSEQIKTPAGTFNCTVVEVVLSFETRKKLWMINNKPGIYAKIITDKPSEFGMYSVFELQEIKMKK